MIEDINESNISKYLFYRKLEYSIVSGALDRLHYEKDASVKYDTDRKIWIYLHKNRTLDYPAWSDSSNPTPNTLDTCSFNPFLHMHEGPEEEKKELPGNVPVTAAPASNGSDNIVVIKLDETSKGGVKRTQPEPAAIPMREELVEIKKGKE